ncbi:metalloregulator ArsR/SmtB family transcription factor [Ferroplasma sp.]|uniref:ArsR/SmtB family transcription factor n=1 Tax=Ferroplasma sp. TaxID=2591003 RepID=UPI00260A9E5E|nr:metalloregulator ArsR/SmtB family transcription factor [Ferroplasma sp.]
MKILGDKNRLYIFLLLNKRELCVCEITAISHLSQSNVSQHLAKLKAAGLVKERKDAQWVYYSINELVNPLIDKIIKLLPDPEIDVSKLTTLKSHPACKL